MKLLLPGFLIVFILFSCSGQNQQSSETIDRSASSEEDRTADDMETGNLIAGLYEWVETKSSKEDFVPKQAGNKYVSLDLSKHTERLAELKATGFFSAEFLENYDRIALEIDEKLKDGSLEWFPGELPPFGNGANPWCNCQDNPDEYWKNLKYKTSGETSGSKTVTWTFGDKNWDENFQYKLEMTKENDILKIDWMQGFDFADFF